MRISPIRAPAASSSAKEGKVCAAAATAQIEVTQQAVKDADAAIVEAQRKFDTFAAATYVNGPSASLVMARTPDEIIASASAGESFALSARQVMADLRGAKTRAVDSDAAAQDAKLKADEAVEGAQASQDAAVAALRNAQENFRKQQVEIDRLAAARKQAQQKLEAARSWSTPASAGVVANGGAGVPEGQGPSGEGRSSAGWMEAGAS